MLEPTCKVLLLSRKPMQWVAGATERVGTGRAGIGGVGSRVVDKCVGVAFVRWLISPRRDAISDPWPGYSKTVWQIPWHRWAWSRNSAAWGGGFPARAATVCKPLPGQG